MEAGNTSTLVAQENSKLSRVHSNVDRLSDDILISILSLLTVEEAATTSILSHRWRYLWMHTTGCWSFDFSGEVNKMVDKVGISRVMEILPYHSLRSLCSVTRVTALHRGPYLNEFRLVAYMDPSVTDDIDQLLYFACQKGVQKLELDFKNCFIIRPLKRYSFPNLKDFKLLLTAGDMEIFQSQHKLRGIKLGVHHLRGFCCLRSLCLRYVDVSEEVLDCIFSNCTSLESILLEESYELVILKVHGLHLRHFEMINCFNLKSLEISAANLESFIYLGPKIDVPFGSIPHSLLEVTIGGSFGESFVFESAKHVVYLSQLESLTFDVSFDVNLRIFSFPTAFPEMINLKHLELKVKLTSSQSLLPYTTFIKACPFLSTFRMKYFLQRLSTLRQSLIGVQTYHMRSSGSWYAHQHLEVVEFIGFLGCANELNLATRLLQVAVNLNRMVFQFHSEELREERFSKELVAWYGRTLPPAVELVVC